MAEQVPIRIYESGEKPSKVLEQTSGLVFGFPVHYQTILQVVEDPELLKIANTDGPTYAMLDGGLAKFNRYLHEKFPVLSEGIGLHMNWEDEKVSDCRCMLGIKYAVAKPCLLTDLRYMEVSSVMDPLTPQRLYAHIAESGSASMLRALNITGRYLPSRQPVYSELGAQLVKSAKSSDPMQSLGLGPMQTWMTYFRPLDLADYLRLTLFQRSFALSVPAYIEKELGASFLLWD